MIVCSTSTWEHTCLHVHATRTHTSMCMTPMMSSFTNSNEINDLIAGAKSTNNGHADRFAYQDTILNWPISSRVVQILFCCRGYTESSRENM